MSQSYHNITAFMIMLTKKKGLFLHLFVMNICDKIRKYMIINYMYVFRILSNGKNFTVTYIKFDAQKLKSLAIIQGTR